MPNGPLNFVEDKTSEKGLIHIQDVNEPYPLCEAFIAVHDTRTINPKYAAGILRGGVYPPFDKPNHPRVMCSKCMAKAFKLVALANYYGANNWNRHVNLKVARHLLTHIEDTLKAYFGKVEGTCASPPDLLFYGEGKKHIPDIIGIMFCGLHSFHRSCLQEDVHPDDICESCLAGWIKEMRNNDNGKRNMILREKWNILVNRFVFSDERKPKPSATSGSSLKAWIKKQKEKGPLPESPFKTVSRNELPTTDSMLSVKEINEVEMVLKRVGTKDRVCLLANKIEKEVKVCISNDKTQKDFVASDLQLDLLLEMLQEAKNRKLF